MHPAGATEFTADYVQGYRDIETTSIQVHTIVVCTKASLTSPLWEMVLSEEMI